MPSYNLNACNDYLEVRYYHIGLFFNICERKITDSILSSLFLGQPGPKFCGTGANTNNLQFVSSNRYIMLVFQSTVNYAGRGFSAVATLI
jgi:hypothetical protein